MSVAENLLQRPKPGLYLAQVGACGKDSHLRRQALIKRYGLYAYSRRPAAIPASSEAFAFREAGKNVATHPVAQLSDKDIPVAPLLQHPHRLRSPRTHTFHTIYDGDGKRVKKYVPPQGENPGETTLFVYDAAGKLIEEYSTIVASEQEAKVAYLTNDHLGSPRINTDANGAVTARHDYHPFGEEIATSQRTADLGYAGDMLRKQFTGYERDEEVDLDYARARMYASKLGRFTTTDPSQKSVDKMSPQTWNRYTYCYNNPLTLVDENGKWPTGTHSRIINQALNIMSEKFRSSVRWGSIKTDYPGTVLERNAHKHAMTPASHITKSCDVNCAKGKAQEQAMEFVNTNLNKASEKFKEAQKYEQGSDQGVALVKESLTYFGRAIHTVMDNVSPAHEGFQIFTGYTTTLASSGVVGTAQDISDHDKVEERDPSKQEYDVMSDRIRALFQEVYGQDAYNSSVSEEERKKTRERSSQPGFSVAF